MPNLDVEQLVARISAEVTAQVLDHLARGGGVLRPWTAEPAADADDWPEWDEFGGLTAPTPAPVAQEPEPEPPGHSPLRARARGLAAVPELVEDDDDTGPITSAGQEKGRVVEMGYGDASLRGNGFNPHESPDWWAANYRRDVEAQRRKVPYEDEVTQVK